MANSGSSQLSSGHHSLYCGNSKHRSNGVGLLLSPMEKAALREFNLISERTITARFNSKFRKISIVQCYAPTEPDEDHVKYDCYNQLETDTNSLHATDIKIFLGYFNAIVGTYNKNLQSIMGKLGASRSSNGNRLVDFCVRNRLFIGGTKFIHKDNHKYTWALRAESPTRQAQANTEYRVSARKVNNMFRADHERYYNEIAE